MKNLMKSASCGNPAKFVGRAETPNNNIDVSENNSKGSSKFNLENYSKKRKLALNSVQVKSETNESQDPIFKNFDFSADMVSPQETSQSLKEYGFSFYGNRISIRGMKNYAGRRIHIELDNNTKGIILEAMGSKIKMIILNKKGPDDTEVFHFGTGKVTYNGKDAGFTVPISNKYPHNIENNIGGLKISSYLRVEDNAPWLQEVNVALVPDNMKILQAAADKGYYLRGSYKGGMFSKNGTIAIYDKNNKLVYHYDNVSGFGERVAIDKMMKFLKEKVSK